MAHLNQTKTFQLIWIATARFHFRNIFFSKKCWYDMNKWRLENLPLLSLICVCVCVCACLCVCVCVCVFVLGVCVWLSVLVKLWNKAWTGSRVNGEHAERVTGMWERVRAALDSVQTRSLKWKRKVCGFFLTNVNGVMNKSLTHYNIINKKTVRRTVFLLHWCSD